MPPRDLVFTFWRETWSSAAKRQFMPPDRVARELLASAAINSLLVADPFRSGPTQFLLRLRGRPTVPFPTSATARLTSPMRFRREDEMGPAALERTYSSYDRRIEAEARNMDLQFPALITTNPFYAAYGPLAWAGPVTYYAWDDWAALPTLRKWWPALRDAYARVRGRGHRVCAVSQTLLDLLDPMAPAAVVPNAIFPSEWQPPWMEPPWLSSTPRPRILYVGAIHSRLDLDAVQEISRAFPVGSLIFAGPVLDPEVATRLRSMANVHLKDPLPRKAIAGLTHGADVCIMPHLKNDLTKSMSPLKIYEYCAAGRVSVVTDLPPVHGIHPAVRIVPEGASFADAVAEALKDGPIPEEDRRDFLNRNSWARRSQSLLDLALQ
jgi:teichuronic acid biosynthesis glycosyltransferase TuaH